MLATAFTSAGLYAQVPNSTTVTAPKSASHVEADGNKTEAPTPAQKAKKEVDQIESKVKLTEDQHKKITEALVQFHTERDQIKKADAGQHSDEAKAKLKDLRTALEAKVKGMLTPEQAQSAMEVIQPKAK